MTAIARAERPSLLGVTAAAATYSAAPDREQPPVTGTTQQRHAARVDQQYAIAQYAAQQQYVQQERARYPDGNLPPIRDLTRETTPARGPSDILVAKARELVQLRIDGTVTDAEFVAAMVKLLRPAS